MSTDPRPVFLVGPPRSGTKLLRDTLAHHPLIASVPHNLDTLWRIGQRERDHDEYPPESLSEPTRRTLREKFPERFSPAPVLLEKNTCHSLRMEYVAAVFPEARFVGILRDPRDAVSSIRRRWKDPIDLSYLRTALRTWGPGDLLIPGVVSLWKTLRRRLLGRPHLSTWGPRVRGLEELARTASLLECSLEQWKRCTRGLLDYRRDHPDRVHTLRYEDLLESPAAGIQSLLNHLELEPSEEVITFARGTYSRRSVGRWRKDLTDDEVRRLQSAVGDLAARAGYGELS